MVALPFPSSSPWLASRPSPRVNELHFGCSPAQTHPTPQAKEPRDAAQALPVLGTRWASCPLAGPPWACWADQGFCSPLHMSPCCGPDVPFFSSFSLTHLPPAALTFLQHLSPHSAAPPPTSSPSPPPASLEQEVMKMSFVSRRL